MEALMVYFKEKKAEITFTNIIPTENQLVVIPSPLHALYQTIESVTISYAPFLELTIYGMEDAIKSTETFHAGAGNLDKADDWFVFGQGIGEEYLLCAFVPSYEGFHFTMWHHDWEEIDDASYDDLLSMIEANEEDCADIIAESIDEDED